MEGLRDALGLIPNGVFLIGAANGTDRYLYTATWLTQVSSRPPRVATAVRPDHHGCRLIQATGRFTVNCLEVGQVDLARAGFGHDGDRLAGLPWTPCPLTGAPVLADAMGYLGCRVAEWVAVGDHLLAVADIVTARKFFNGRPLAIQDTPWTYG